MGDIVRDKLRADLAESIRWAERTKFWRDFWKSAKDSVFRIGIILSVFFAVGLAHRGEWRAAKALGAGFVYVVLLGLADALADRIAVRRQVLHDRAARVGLVRRKRESPASFERRIALQEQMADLP